MLLNRQFQPVVTYLVNLTNFTIYSQHMQCEMVHALATGICPFVGESAA
jgi:hypothetical protein